MASQVGGIEYATGPDAWAYEAQQKRLAETAAASLDLSWGR